MTNRRMLLAAAVTVAAVMALAGCGERQKFDDLQQLAGKEFAIPTGTVADKLVLSVIPDARFEYFNTVLDAAMAVKQGKADAAAYDEPILRNIAARNPGLRVLPEMITRDDYGFAVRQEDRELKQAIDEVVRQMRSDGSYDAMIGRWLPERGAPKPMPDLPTGSGAVLRFGTAAVTEPFSFVDASQRVVGLDVEIAARVAARLGRRLDVVNMDFGAMIPALIAGKVDMIGACITITGERAQRVLFSEPYYTGGIAALVAQ